MMKFIYKLSGIFLISLLFVGCEEYLERTPGTDTSAEEIFSTYNTFQGFVDVCYSQLIDYNTHALTTGLDIGGEVVAIQSWSSADRGVRGNYRSWLEDPNDEFGPMQSILVMREENKVSGHKPTGIWPNGWRGIRQANIGLENLHLLTNATQEQKDLIEGQCYFFRAYLHWEIIRFWGGMPYIDRVLAPDDDLKLPRISYVETTKKIVEDLDRAAALLPLDWDQTVTGGQIAGFNAGRATKGAALATKAKALLYAGSPLMQLFSGSETAAHVPNSTVTFNKDLMTQAAEAAAEVLKLADQGVYGLVSFDNYQDNFAKNDGTVPWTEETIFKKVTNAFGVGNFDNRLQRLYGPGDNTFNKTWSGGNGICETATQNFVDKFEMADGTRYKLEYDTDDAKRWENRDPRFRKAIWVDRDNAGYTSATILTLYEDPPNNELIVKTSGSVLTPYITHKYWPVGVNKIDKDWTQFIFNNPHIRLAEVYLIYAEAVYEATGSYTASSSNYSMTALEALNTVRRRAGMPDAVLSEYADFRELVRNERAVELCFEGQYWFDIRRWYIAHTIEKDLYDLEFDKDWTYFRRVVVRTRVFDNPRHYWIPILQTQTQIYDGMAQNPGW